MERSLFFDNDQDYSSADWARYFAGMVTNGVNVYGNLESLKIEKNVDNKVKVKDGKAIINGYYYEAYNNDTTVDVPATTAAQRIDRIVLRLDLTQDNWKISAYCKQGTAAAPPAPTRTNEIHEISLATITIPANQATVANATITDDRPDNTVCGLLSFMGNAPYYPSSAVPSELWLYSMFPGELTTEQKAAIESNPSLMAKWQASRYAYLKNFSYYRILRDVEGGVVFKDTPMVQQAQPYSISNFSGSIIETGLIFTADLTNVEYVKFTINIPSNTTVRVYEMNSPDTALFGLTSSRPYEYMRVSTNFKRICQFKLTYSATGSGPRSFSGFSIYANEVVEI